MGLTSGEKSFWGRSDGNEAVSRVSRACTSAGSACEVSVERGMLAIWSKVEVVDAIELLSTWGRERGHAYVLYLSTLEPRLGFTLVTTLCVHVPRSTVLTVFCLKLLWRLHQHS